MFSVPRHSQHDLVDPCERANQLYVSCIDELGRRTKGTPEGDRMEDMWQIRGVAKWAAVAGEDQQQRIDEEGARRSANGVALTMTQSLGLAEKSHGLNKYTNCESYREDYFLCRKQAPIMPAELFKQEVDPRCPAMLERFKSCLRNKSYIECRGDLAVLQRYDCPVDI
eukprot:TRINITY_DN8838_c1_g2_i1.p1 TRINITY_DN8838_c1_g2~~TRINITY_DN8838_c1_g2_i1.p1  ORF type:complete len:168 (+),score=0.54 TRINITY_DN8838_c1_g2_i1:47-550(+)